MSKGDDQRPTSAAKQLRQLGVSKERIAALRAALDRKRSASVLEAIIGSDATDSFSERRL